MTFYHKNFKKLIGEKVKNRIKSNIFVDVSEKQ